MEKARETAFLESLYIMKQQHQKSFILPYEVISGNSTLKKEIDLSALRILSKFILVEKYLKEPYRIR
jgi:hypothetical protein